MMSKFNIDRHFTIKDNVLKGEEVSYHEEYNSFGEFVLRKLEDNPDLVGQIDAVTDEKYTYEKMRERSLRCALWMQSQGLRARDVVALCSDDHLDFAMPCFAALYLGAIYSPWDPSTSTVDLIRKMTLTIPKMAFVSKDSATVIAEAAKKAKLNLKIVVFGCVPSFLEFDSIIAEPSVDEVNKFVCTPIESPEEIALILSSSGTTGLPKGVPLSHRALNLLKHTAKAHNMAGKVCFSYTVTEWINMVTSMVIPLMVKIPRMVLPPFEEYSACALIEKYKASWIFLTPFMINKLVKCDAVDMYDLSSLKMVHYSGSPLSVSSYRALKKLLPELHIISCYGMTEACGFVSMQSSRSQPRSCGYVMENSQVKVIDPDIGRTLGANESGELLLKSAAMMRYYLNDPVATAQFIDDDGWIHSGDLGYYDETGEIFFIDRLKDIIRCAAEHDVAPSEIESVILTHPGVREVAVVGQPQPDDDTFPIAFVVRTDFPPDTGKQVTETEIVNLVAAELQDIRKELRGGVRFLDHLPKTSTNKIKRRVLRELSTAAMKI